MNFTDCSDKSHPVWVLTSLFDAHKRLIEAMRRQTMAGEDVTIPEADALIILQLRWPEFRADAKGFIAFKDLAAGLVHGDSQLSRRMASLVKRGLVTVRETGRGPGSSRFYRITTKGAEIAGRIWEKYCRLAEAVLRDIPFEQLRTHRSISEHIEAGAQGFELAQETLAQEAAKSEQEEEIDWAPVPGDPDSSVELIDKIFPTAPMVRALHALGFSNVVVECWDDKPISIRMNLDPNPGRTEFEVQLAIRVCTLELGRCVTDATVVLDRNANTVVATVHHQKT